MDPTEVSNAQDARNIVEEMGLSHVKVGLFDIDGVLRGKYMSREKFFSALEKGFGFCDVVMGWDSNDQLYDNVKVTGWATGYPDAPARIIPESCRPLPTEGEDSIFFLCEFADPVEAVCPRGTLRRVLAKAEDMGLFASAAFEYEFFAFNETPDSIRQKGYRNLEPITPGNFGYSVLRNSVWADLYHDLLALCDAMDFPLEGLHTETGPGVLEAAIAYDDALASADKAGLFKTFSKVMAQQNDMMLTFMAKWSGNYPGQSGHIHVSMRDKDGNSAFYDADQPYQMSETMRQFVAGQQKYMPEMLAMVSPTVNAFTRLVPGFWAPTSSSWGVENRTCALRVINGSPSAQRVEYRVAAADTNPYIGLSAALASGLAGIEEKLDLDAPVEGNGYEKPVIPERAFPATLWDAAQRLKASDTARRYLGDAFVDHFAATREWEEREYRKHVSDWELQRYFEII